MANITIGIPTYNGARRLGWLLSSIAMRTPEILTGEARVVVVDDGSPEKAAVEGTVRSHQGQIPIEFIRHDHNRGISAGWNACSRALQTPYVVLANDDVIVSKDWLRPIVHVLEHSPKAGVVGQSWHAFVAEDVPGLLKSEHSDSEVLPRDPGTKAQDPSRRSRHENTDPGRVMCPTGQLFGFRRSDFDAIGGFDERMLSFYEESSFGTEMAARGLIGVQTNWPFCWHMWSQTFATNPELGAGARMEQSRSIYRERWKVPDSFKRGDEFSYTNPKYLGAIPDVEIEFLRRGNEVWRGVLRTDGAFVDGRRIR
jgi:GT2 family glycosyltransferase